MWSFIILQFVLRAYFKEKYVREFVCLHITLLIRNNRSVRKVFTDFKGSREKEV